MKNKDLTSLAEAYQKITEVVMGSTFDAKALIAKKKAAKKIPVEKLTKDQLLEAIKAGHIDYWAFEKWLGAYVSSIQRGPEHGW